MTTDKKYIGASEAAIRKALRTIADPAAEGLAAVRKESWCEYVDYGRRSNAANEARALDYWRGELRKALDAKTLAAVERKPLLYYRAERRENDCRMMLRNIDVHGGLVIYGWRHWPSYSVLMFDPID